MVFSVILQITAGFLGLLLAGFILDFFYRGENSRGVLSCLVSAVIAFVLFILAFYLLNWVLPGNNLVQIMAYIIVYGSILWVSYQMEEVMELVVMGVTLVLWMYVQNLFFIASTLNMFTQ